MTGANGRTGAGGLTPGIVNERVYRFFRQTVPGGGEGGLGLGLTFTAVKTANYAASAEEFVPCDVSGGAFGVTLPAAPPNMTMVAVQVVKWAAGGYVAVDAGGTDTIRTTGVTSVLLDSLDAVAWLIYGAATTTWYSLSANPGGPNVSEQVANYNVGQADGGNVLVFNGSSLTATLLATAPPSRGKSPSSTSTRRT